MPGQRGTSGQGRTWGWGPGRGESSSLRSQWEKECLPEGQGDETCWPPQPAGTRSPTAQGQGNRSQSAPRPVHRWLAGQDHRPRAPPASLSPGADSGHQPPPWSARSLALEASRGTPRRPRELEASGLLSRAGSHACPWKAAKPEAGGQGRPHLWQEGSLACSEAVGPQLGHRSQHTGHSCAPQKRL